MTLKLNSKAPTFVIPSTSKDKYSLKENTFLYWIKSLINPDKSH